MREFRKPSSILLLLLACMIAPGTALAAAAPPAIDSGSTAWMLVSTLLVLMMIIPGLALFYGGMVHKESVLATLMQSFVTCCLVSVLWVVYGYSYAFTEGNGFLGGASRIFLHGLTLESTSGTAPALIPESVFVMFQLTFAAITCALIFGSVANRIKFSSGLVFIALWFTLVYIPIAHWVWGPKGMLGGTGDDKAMGLLGFGTTLDFAGGTVVHINAGIAGLMAAFVLGAHRTFGKPNGAPPYNIVFSVIGASLLWVGWFGFNAGSATAANFNAGMAMLVTHIATATAALTWMGVEWASRGKPSVIGIISGAVAGLVAITPASGFVDVTGAFVIGIAAGALCFWGCRIKHHLRFDDSLDVFGVHCIGGIVGALLTGIFAVESIGGKAGSLTQFFAQCEGVVVTLIYGGIVSFIILKVVDIIMGLRVDEAAEIAGLDMAIHGEQIH
ncbi:MAG: ammonium transporter [Alphaproteobacteria bacterium]|nr:ammonium transporter [Alphaproteobacteria bacterium]